jgi:hypothetical protein
VRNTAKKHGAKKRIVSHIADGDDTLLVGEGKCKCYEQLYVLLFAILAVAGTEWALASRLSSRSSDHADIPARHRTWRGTQEVALYLSSCPIKAADAARVIRGHWGIEQGCITCARTHPASIFLRPASPVSVPVATTMRISTP